MLPSKSFVAFADDFVRSTRSLSSVRELEALVEAATADLGFRYYALAHHDDLREPCHGRVKLWRYPEPVLERLVDQVTYRRDPVIRGCLFSDGAFLWSELDQIIPLDKRDRAALAIGTREGLNEGITVPYNRLGDCMGSFTLAGRRQRDSARRFLGMAQMIGIFSFQAARRLMADLRHLPRRHSIPHPRIRECIVLVGRGCSNKEIARALAITPRTVDGYLTEARRIFGVHDRTELVVTAVLAGEVGLHELRPRQPE